MKKMAIRFLSSLVLLVLLCILPLAALAAGVETLPYEEYSIGSFDFFNYNLSPVKTVAGSKVQFAISFEKASYDAGLGNVKLTFQIRDLSGNVLYQQIVADNGYGTYFLTSTVNLGYSGRKIQLFFDASSVGTSNGNYRSINVTSFRSIVS